MNKLLKGFLLGVVATFLVVGSAIATPIFSGDPLADFGIGDAGLPSNPQGPGYYIWANDSARTSWSVRWTGRDWSDADLLYEWYDWAGSITFSNNEGIEDAVEVLWDAHDTGSLIITDLGGSDMITFTQPILAGPHWDGFDFTLTGVIGDYLTFNLFSSYFNSDNDGIYIGQDMLSVLDHSDTPDLFRSGSGTNRQFEIAAPVPEPATMLLLGMGLLGLAGITRKRTKA